MTTTSNLASLGSALAGIGQVAIGRARHGQELAIHDRLRAYTDQLRVNAAALLARKPDPTTWTPDDHAVFILAAEAPTGFSVATDSGPTASTVVDAAQRAVDTLYANRDREIPF